ncbi:flagellar hook-basal body complex protein FliE [Undibacterium sp. TJN25]|uniref:flagellar hook-basal body complex protein FliE n=1 Tax=Undibacterium sp. TJN25 TaxID=3413056 RepID=UPI003BF10A7F
MTVEPVSAITAPALIEPDAFVFSSNVESVGGNFAGWFTKEVGAVNDNLVEADHAMQKLAVGSEQSLHEVMIKMEEARLSFQLLAQVRNRLLEAYQEVMRMQV